MRTCLADACAALALLLYLGLFVLVTAGPFYFLLIARAAFVSFGTRPTE